MSSKRSPAKGINQSDTQSARLAPARHSRAYKLVRHERQDQTDRGDQEKDPELDPAKFRNPSTSQNCAQRRCAPNTHASPPNGDPCVCIAPMRLSPPHHLSGARTNQRIPDRVKAHRCTNRLVSNRTTDPDLLGRMLTLVRLCSPAALIDYEFRQKRARRPKRGSSSFSAADGSVARRRRSCPF
jgi:hypothetical protein